VTEIELTGTVVPAVPGDAAGRLQQATLGWLIGQKSIHTFRAYRRDVVGVGTNDNAARMPVPAWLVWCEQRRLNPLAAKRVHVDAYAKLILAAGQSPATWARKVSAISSWYDYLIEDEITDRNPAKKASRPDIDREVSPATGLSEEELDLLLDEAERDGPRSLALMSLLYFGALRIGSVLAADIGHVGWDQGSRSLKLTLKGGKVRRAIIEEEAGDALDGYLATRGEPDPQEPLFTTGTGGRLDEAYCWRLIRRLAKKAGIKSWAQLSPHSLRHTHATHALDAKEALDVVQRTLGHVDQRTTLRYDRARELRKKRSGTVLSERRAKARKARGGEDRD
jgi:integrase/recombinase XerD